MKNAFSCQKRKLLIVQNDKSDVDKIGKGWYIPDDMCLDICPNRGMLLSLTVIFEKTPQKGLFYIAFPAVLFRFVINS